MLTAIEAHEQATAGDRVIGWKVDPDQRRTLLQRLPPKYSRAIADHVTLKPRVAADAPLPPPCRAEIVGRSDDRRGVEALVVRVDGSTDRPGGGTYHITWSLSPGRKARESNDAIARHGWQAIDPPIPVRLEPAVFP